MKENFSNEDGAERVCNETIEVVSFKRSSHLFMNLLHPCIIHVVYISSILNNIKVQSHNAVFHPIFLFDLLLSKIIPYDHISGNLKVD